MPITTSDKDLTALQRDHAALVARCAALEAENAALREALQPFADAYDQLPIKSRGWSFKVWNDDDEMYRFVYSGNHPLSSQHLLAAQDALAAAPAPDLDDAALVEAGIDAHIAAGNPEYAPERHTCARCGEPGTIEVYTGVWMCRYHFGALNAGCDDD